MRILYIWDADYPWDVRVEKICKSLLDHGYEVHIAARNLKRLPQYEVIDGFHVHRIKPFVCEALNYAISFPVFFSPVWLRFLNQVIHRHEIEIIIVRDLPLAIAGIWMGMSHDLPVILDMAEDYTAMLWDIWRASKFKRLNFVIRNPHLSTVVERYVFRRADHILVVVEEAEQVVLRKGGKPNQITIVGNTPVLEFFKQNTAAYMDNIYLIKERFSVIYTGGIQMGRGIQTVITAIPSIIHRIPDLLFVIVGRGYAFDQLRELVHNNGVEDYILWVGWVNHEEIAEYICASRVGIIPHLTSDHVNTTVPNKIFDYMALGLPVLTSDAIPLKRIIEEEQCGLTFRSGDPNDLANALVRLYEFSTDMGECGKRAVASKYNWNHDQARLLNVMKMFS